MLQHYYDIIIKNNDLGVVSKLDYDTYKKLDEHFEYVYHTEKGEKYKLHRNIDASIDVLIVDDNLYKLLDDLKEQGFCNSVIFNYIDDYGFIPYVAFLGGE